MPEEIICIEGRWYEVAGVYVCCTEVRSDGVRVKVSTTEPHAKVRRRKRSLDLTPPPPLQLPCVGPVGETTIPIQRAEPV